MITDIFTRRPWDPQPERVFTPCTPEEARQIREQYGLMLPEEKPRRTYEKLRRPTLADYNAMLEEDGKPPIDPEAYKRMFADGS